MKEAPESDAIEQASKPCLVCKTASHLANQLSIPGTSPRGRGRRPWKCPLVWSACCVWCVWFGARQPAAGGNILESIKWQHWAQVTGPQPWSVVVGTGALVAAVFLRWHRGLQHQLPLLFGCRTRCRRCRGRRTGAPATCHFFAVSLLIFGAAARAWPLIHSLNRPSRARRDSPPPSCAPFAPRQAVFILIFNG